MALDGGWRIYSSGPGIALGLIVGSLLGIRRECATLIVDPVIPHALDGLRARLAIAGHAIEIVYRIGPSAHEPTQLRLNGHGLAFRRRENRYRVGAAEVDMAAFVAGCATGTVNTLCVQVG